MYVSNTHPRMQLIGSLLMLREKVHPFRSRLKPSYDQHMPSPDQRSLTKASPSSLPRASWHHLPLPTVAQVNHVPPIHPEITAGSEQTQSKPKYLPSHQQCSPHLETLSFTLIQCQNVMIYAVLIQKQC